MNNNELAGSNDSFASKKQFLLLQKHKKLKRTSFFLPINTLTRPVTNENHELEPVITRNEISFPKTYPRNDDCGDEDTLSMRPTTAGFERKGNNAINISSPNNTPKTPIKLNEIQNSDDSFDGIRWGQPNNQPPSSPLRDFSVRNNTKPNKSQNVANNYSEPSILINEQTNSVLNKYGSNNLHTNLIQTPSLLRTQSESITLTKSNNHGKNIPNLLRTKSIAADFFKTSSNLSNSTLNDWIDKLSSKSDNQKKFEDSDLEDDDTFEKLTVKDLNNINKIAPNSVNSNENFGKTINNNNNKDSSSGNSNNINNISNININSNNNNTKIYDDDNNNNNNNANNENSNDKNKNDDVDNDEEGMLDDLIISNLTDSLNKLESPLKVRSTKIEIFDLKDTNQNASKPNGAITPNMTNKMESDDMDPFSDDDELILEALNKATNSQKLGSVIELSKKDNSDSDDPFTDDDSDLMNVLEAAINPQDEFQSSTKFSNIAILKSFSGVSKFNIRQEFSSGTFQQQIETNPIENNSVLSFSRPNLNRYQIRSKLQRNYGPGLSKKQVILDVIDENSIDHKLIVRGEYTDLEYEANDIVHVIVTNPSNPRLIDDSINLLIWNPDILLSATTISNQIICSRKTVLTSRYKFPGVLSIPLIVGEIVHRVFQECFYRECWTCEFIRDLADKYVLEYIHSIFSIDETIDKVRDEIEKHLPYLHTWFEKYYRKPLSTLNYIPTNKHNESIMFSVNKALDIEENILSPMFGLNGMVDVTLETKLENKVTKGQYLLPLEIKTGREYITHLAQATLYSLLFKDRYDMDIESFLLVYTKSQLTKKCDISQNDLKALVNLRNKVTKYFKENVRELPALLQSSTCERCEIQGPCMTINKLLENGTGNSSGLLEEDYDDLTSHLSDNPLYAQFYNYWDDLLTKEESFMKKTIKYLWTLTAKQRESTDGKAIGNLVIVESDDDNDGDKYDESKRFIYKLTRSSMSSTSFLGTQLVVGDRIIISDEVGHFGIAHGIVREVNYSTITISTSRRIINSDMKLSNFNKSNNQLFQGVLHKTQQENKSTGRTFRIDKNEMYTGMALARYNVLNLFLSNGDEARRKLIVEMKPPRFSSASFDLPSKLTSDLNTSQIAAIEKVLTAQDYALLLGMPGTGKTTVISRLIKILTDNGKSILLASYTHSAVDNILLKIKDYGISILRVGYHGVVHKDIRQFIPTYGDDDKIDTHDKFLKAYLTPQVVASSCLGINDITFSIRDKFDYCIIDEASQVSMPISLGPLRFCEKFVLVGDHNQLPPLVQHPDFRVKQELSQSLFMKLATKYPQSVATLTYQYRMCSDIMELANVLIYENELRCGTKSVADQTLSIPLDYMADDLSSANISKSDRWMDIVLKESNRVVFLDHDRVPALESNNGEIIENRVEAKLITQIVNAFLHYGVDEDSIGVMSFNRGQLRLLKRNLSDRNVEILTADQFQGRDKDCIIISLVRSNEENKAGDLVKEWRRINVAITRAKCKLIILGSKSTLMNAQTTKKFLELLSSKGWLYQLPSKADTFYNFEDTSLLNSASKSKRHKVATKLLKSNTILKDIMNEMITG